MFRILNWSPDSRHLTLVLNYYFVWTAIGKPHAQIKDFIRKLCTTMSSIAGKVAKSNRRRFRRRFFNAFSTPNKNRWNVDVDSTSTSKYPYFFNAFSTSNQRRNCPLGEKVVLKNMYIPHDALDGNDRHQEKRADEQQKSGGKNESDSARDI